MISMRQAMEVGLTYNNAVSELLSSVLQDVSQAVSGNDSGAQLLHELLNAPWLHALLQVYECLLQFQRLTPSPFLPYASGLSHEIMAIMRTVPHPSAEARELYNILRSPHIQAVLSSHDSVAQLDYGPVLPPLPDDLPEGEEAMRIVCLVKNKQPLNGEEQRGSIGGGGGLIRGWNSLRRLTLQRLVPGRRAWSREDLRTDEGGARLLPHPRGSQPHPFLPRYESTGSCCLCRQTTELWKKGLNQSAPSVYSPAPCSGSFLEKSNYNGEVSYAGDSNDDYAYPPPPVPAYSLSVPNSPVLYQKMTRGGHSRNIPTPGRTPSCPGINPPRALTAPSSPATRRPTRQQGVSTLPISDRHHGCPIRPQNGCQDGPQNRPTLLHYSTAPRHNGCQNQPKQTRNDHPGQPKHHQRRRRSSLELIKQHSMEELKSTVQTVASTMEHGTQDVRHLGQKMVAATEMMSDSVEENAQALNLLAEVVDKLQGLIVASKPPESSPPRRPKQRTPPPPPPRVSSISPKTKPKPPKSHQRHLSSSSTSSSCSSSSSSSSTSISSYGVNFATTGSAGRMNGGSKKRVVTSSATQSAGGVSSNGQVRLNNGAVSRVPLEDHNTTGCLPAKKRKKKK